MLLMINIEVLLRFMQSLSYTQLKELWKCNDKLMDLNVGRLKDMNLEKCLTPAIISYEGIQYQYMAPEIMESSQLAYIQEHLYILSAFYGVLKPFDGVVPYRLEMQAKLAQSAMPENVKDLYAFWDSKIYERITKDDHVILNLASKEYSKVIEKYISAQDRFVTCIFGEYHDGKVITKGTIAKMARGEMVRFLSEINAQMPEDVKGFNRLGFCYAEELSDDLNYVFIKS